MVNPKIVEKASGEREPYSQLKLSNSLKRAGAGDAVIAEVLSNLEPWIYNGVSTRKIYKKAFRLLKTHRRALAARYSLKSAIMELGPTGYPFENFVAHIFSVEGMSTEVGVLIKGKCVMHEVDVLASLPGKELFVECKYYNSQAKNANVKVPLYIHSRFRDIVENKLLLAEYADFDFQGWIVTNTRFTSDAISYGKCAGLKLLSWDYPTGRSLKDLIEKAGLFPITVLTSLDKDQKRQLLDSGKVLCRQIVGDEIILETLNLTEHQKRRLMLELSDLLN
jgi:hypothetical protein